MLNKKRREEEKQMIESNRLPPGQSLTRKFPVLHYGPIPRTPLSEWTMRIFGLVDEEKTWSWEQFQKLPSTKIKTDIHCVTKWSKFDTEWEGVLFRDIVDLVGVKPETKYVIAHCEYGYTTNTPYEAMLDEDVLLTYKYDGKPLDPEHGFPVRTLVPKLYLWKSAKWLRGIEFSDVDRPGFWEQAGYHNVGDPWKEERYGR